jgi:hypothetical protein
MGGVVRKNSGGLKLGAISTGQGEPLPSGILDPHSFFDTSSLGRGVSELCGGVSTDISVHFLGMRGYIDSGRKSGDGNWWDAFQEFVPLVKNSPTGCETKYYVREEEPPISKFDERNLPYQSFVELFGGAVKGFSCFVNENPKKVSFSCWSTNYDIIKPGEAFFHHEKSLWEGDSRVFLESAEILSDAFLEMERRGYKTGAAGEVRIICPDKGALIGHLFRGGEGESFLLDASYLEERV